MAIKIERVEVDTSGLLNSVVEFTVILDTATVSSALIKIEDSAMSNKVLNVAMTNVADYVYTYNWQSAQTDLEGTFVATFYFSDGINRTAKETEFDMERPYDKNDIVPNI